ncbi:transcription initiation factor TFIID subunit 4b [Impatiens glandulifera]|uniref:transcription initiation factor TFIID subunit 4b n=1 Tax=Impatiens glandulifera TaxID=253017 RepID=UPI001FB19B7B|nr:transcription initiation factor TFIID subunit 4b [Impatiens glandulifera]
MDPSIMKLLEEDEDETMHSGAEVDAFTAALNRDIEGDTSASQPSDSDGAMSQGNNQLIPQWQSSSQGDPVNNQSHPGSNKFFSMEQLPPKMELHQQEPVMDNQQQQQQQQQTIAAHELSHSSMQQQPQDSYQLQLPQSALPFSHKMGVSNLDRNSMHIREPERGPKPQVDPQLTNLQKMHNQPAIPTEQATNPNNRSKQVPFGLLLPVILPQLDKDRAMQLQTLYLKLRKNEITKDGFVRHMRAIIGDQMLRMAVLKLQTQAARNSQTSPNPFSSQSQNANMTSMGSNQGTVPQSFAQLHQKDSNIQKSQEMDRQADTHGMPVSQMSTSSLSNLNQERERPVNPMQGFGKQQQQHLHFSQQTFPMYGSSVNNYHSFSGANANATPASLKQQSHDPPMRQNPVHQNIGTPQLGGASQSMSTMNMPKFERQIPLSDTKRVQGGTFSPLTNNSSLQQKSVSPQPPMNFVKQEPVDQMNEQQKSQLSNSQGLSSFPPPHVEHGDAVSGTSKDELFEMQSSKGGFPTSMGIMPSKPPSQLELSSRMPPSSGPGGISKTPLKKPIVGQKKPLESLVSSPPLSSKKQKVSGGFLDQSIEQLNDVTAVSGVNLREEEEQLFSGPKEDSRASEASRRVVQEEEEKLILQKIPLQKKLADIAVKCGVKGISNDVERCLSLCVEEKMRGLISNLIRLSKQRVDVEKSRHRTVVTSDVRQQIMSMNKKAREEWEKKQAEAEKLQKQNDTEGGAGTDGDKDKDDGRGKSIKVNKEEDDKMRTTAANVAARAAAGGDDMLSKWQLMAEQARQKREGVSDVASGSQPTKELSSNTPSSSGKTSRDSQDGENRGQSATTSTSGLGRKFGRSSVFVPQQKVVRTISIKDVIAVLEREPQMAKSTLMYRLYDKAGSDPATE